MGDGGEDVSMPTDWSQRYVQKDMPWEKGRAHPALIEYVAAKPLSGRILVPGCGLGHDVRAVATRTNQPLGVDIAPEAIAGARAHPKVASEEYRQGDFFECVEDEAGAFEWVVEHTCFCAIDPSMRKAYVKAVEHVLKPGGQVLAIFYLDPDYEEGPPFGVEKSELEALFTRFDVLEERRNIRTYPGREGLEILRVLRFRRAIE
jgi:methyl halide transferase